MRRIFISTNYSQLKNVIDTKRKAFEGLKSEDFITFLNEPIILFNDTQGDKISSVPNLPKELSVNNNSDYLLFHTGTSDNIKSSFGSKINGRHENTVGSNYKEVFDIILDSDANKTERILEYLFPEALDNSLKQLHDIADGKEEFEVQGEKVVFNGSPLHIFALAAKRDELLEKKDNAN